MKKVVYSVTRYRKDDIDKISGLGYITDTDLVIACMNKAGKLYLALHILEAIHSSPADYYDYDYSMGTLETPTALTLTFDLVDYCDDKEDTDHDEL